MVVLRELRHLLLRVADHDVRVVNAGHTTTDKDEVKLRVDADDMKVLCGDALAAQPASHFLSGPYTTGVL